VSTATTSYVEVVEGVRATIAAHAHAQDDGRADDLAVLYTPDGVVDVPGIGTFEGAEALRNVFAGWQPQGPQRHLVVNTLVTDWSNDEAQATSDVVFVARGESGWSVQVVGRYFDTFQKSDGAWLLSRRKMEFTM
jgi:ketosteroid isomerase-like protein